MRVNLSPVRRDCEGEAGAVNQPIALYSEKVTCASRSGSSPGDVLMS